MGYSSAIRHDPCRRIGMAGLAASSTQAVRLQKICDAQPYDAE
jgi:hypothetical protein